MGPESGESERVILWRVKESPRFRHRVCGSFARLVNLDFLVDLVEERE